MSDEEGAMVEPLSVAVHTCRRAGVVPGHRVLIFGSGPIGILCGLVAKQMGAVKVLIVGMLSTFVKKLLYSFLFRTQIILFMYYSISTKFPKVITKTDKCLS